MSKDHFSKAEKNATKDTGHTKGHFKGLDQNIAFKAPSKSHGKKKGDLGGATLSPSVQGTKNNASKSGAPKYTKKKMKSGSGNGQSKKKGGKSITKMPKQKITSPPASSGTWAPSFNNNTAIPTSKSDAPSLTPALVPPSAPCTNAYHRNYQFILKNRRHLLTLVIIFLSLFAYTAVPTILSTRVPTNSNTTTNSTNTSTTRVGLKPYTLFYTFNQLRIPTTADVGEVANLTQIYLFDFFKSQYAELDKLQTNLTNSMFLLLQPFEANYTSTALFPSAATTVPTAMDLEATLMSAFIGGNNKKYLAELQGLPTSNIFQTTTEVMLHFQTDPPLKTKQSTGTDEQSKAGVTGGVAAAAGAVAAVLVVLAVRHRRRRNGGSGGKQNGRRNDGTDKNRDDDDNAHLTVAGDTYLADSTIFSGSSARRQTRFSEGTRFLLDENQSLASRSEWGLSTRAISEVGSSDESDEDEPTERRLFADEEEQAYNRTLLNVEVKETKEDVLLAMRDDMRLPRHYSASDERPDNDELSVDADVPMKVVDLIKKFSPSRKSSSPKGNDDACNK